MAWTGAARVDLPKGGNTVLAGHEISAILRTALPPDDIDLSALLVGANRQVRSDADFVFFNQERSPCGSTRRASPTRIEVDLRRVPEQVHAVVIVASLDDSVAGHVAGNGGGELVVEDGATTVRHTMTGLTSERCVLVAELYRRGDSWKLRAISQGYDDLAALVTAFGVDTEDDTSSPVVAPRPAGAPCPPSPPRTPEATREIIDRIRLGAADARAASTRPVRTRPTKPQPRAGTATQYKAIRRAEAARRTAAITEQTRAAENLLGTVGPPDLSTGALLSLIDASVPTSVTSRFRAILGRRDADPARPAVVLAPALDELRRLAATISHTDAVEAWLWAAVHAIAHPPTLGHVVQLGVDAAGSTVVVDVGLPDRTIVPTASSVRYRPTLDLFEDVALPERERGRLVELLFASALLAHARGLAAALREVGLPADTTLVVNGWEWQRDPTTGHAAQVCRGTLATSPGTFDRIDLRGVEPRACIRSLGRIDEAGDVNPLAARGRRRTGRREIDLATIDPYEFEGLVAQLAEAMGYVARRTQRTRDHGVDVVVESNGLLDRGTIVISVKRHTRTVGPDHVRALHSVVQQEGAMKGILVTTSGFGPESRRIAADKPLDLVDGQQLRTWLAEYLDLTAR